MSFGDRFIPKSAGKSYGDGQLSANYKPTGLRSRVKKILKSLLGEKLFYRIILANRKYRYIRRAFLHSNLSNEWYAYFIFTKTAESNEINFHITSHYSELDQT